MKSYVTYPLRSDAEVPAFVGLAHVGFVGPRAQAHYVPVRERKLLRFLRCC